MLAFADFTAQFPHLLAQLPQSNVYVNAFKLVAVLALLVAWALYATWADKDAIAVNTYRAIWNMVNVFCGLIALALLLLLPSFWIALAGYAVFFLGGSIAYVIHRNGLVDDESKVCTPAHIKKLLTEGISGKKKKKEIDVKERVRLVGADRRPVRIPDDDESRERYRLTQDLLFDLLWRRASLVTLTPAGQATKITYSIDGILAERDPVGRPEGDAIVLYLKQLAGLNVEERRKPQFGKLAAAVGENKFDLSIQTNGSTQGERMNVRVIGREKGFKVADIGLTPKQSEQVKTFMDAEKGLVLVTTPKGGGLTTALYTFARSHDAFLLNIQMLEYVKELDIENITQRSFEPSDDKTFTSELQRIVRSDPNVIVLPELRERTAVPIAAKAAADKQKVYVGLQAADAFDALRRWLPLVGDAKLASRSLLAVVHGRLVRVLCTACKTPYKPDPATLRKLNLPADKVLYRPPEPQYDKHGNPVLCQACQGTGYTGRTGIFHLIPVDEGLRQVIAAGGSLADIQAHCVKQGVQGLQQAALQKAFDGVTSIEEVVRATRPPAAANPPDGAPATESPAAPAAAARAKSPASK